MKNSFSHSLQFFTEIYNQKVYKKVKEHKTKKQIYRPIRTPLKSQSELNPATTFLSKINFSAFNPVLTH